MAFRMTTNAWTNNSIRSFRVSKARRMLDAGRSVTEICALLNLSESEVRALIKPCDRVDTKNA